MKHGQIGIACNVVFFKYKNKVFIIYFAICGNLPKTLKTTGLSKEIVYLHRLGHGAVVSEREGKVKVL